MYDKDIIFGKVIQKTSFSQCSLTYWIPNILNKDELKMCTGCHLNSNTLNSDSCMIKRNPRNLAAIIVKKLSTPTSDQFTHKICFPLSSLLFNSSSVPSIGKCRQNRLSIVYIIALEIEYIDQ